ncbi:MULTISPECIES: hypothetical protein [unclassified Peribacillus]|nr:hypothetical protein [Peribacillus sp. Bi96]
MAIRLGKEDIPYYLEAHLTAAAFLFATPVFDTAPAPFVPIADVATVPKA